jgi:hypothetical protein
MNTIFEYNHQPIISWKGKTFNQITSSIKKNPGINNNNNGIHNLFLPNPLKIYRREIANNSIVNTCTKHSSIKIDEFDRPGGSIINTTFDINKNNGLVNTIDNTLPNNICEEPGTCMKFLSPADNARRRVRSAGMIKQKYDPKNRAKYYTDTNQYLTSRNITFEKNQFRYPTSDPSYCVIYNPNNKQFAQQGAVTSSSLIAKVKYDTVNTAALQSALPLGVATSNALAYGVPDNGYTAKDIIGYPLPSYPTFKNGVFKKCSSTNIRG